MNFTKHDLLADEVNIDHDVLGPAVMNRVSCRVYNTDIVPKTIVAKGSGRWRS
jgi:hypothetical protein